MLNLAINCGEKRMRIVLNETELKQIIEEKIRITLGKPGSIIDVRLYLINEAVETRILVTDKL